MLRFFSFPMVSVISIHLLHLWGREGILLPRGGKAGNVVLPLPGCW
jgi:hypothetical protein